MKRCTTALLLLALGGPLLSGGPAGASTLERTLGPSGTGADTRLIEAPGEPHRLRVASPGVRTSQDRASRRRSLAFFAHLSDFQLADEASPARHEHLSGLRPAFYGFWRPQEAFGPHVVDQAVRAINRHQTSPVAGSGGPARLGFALVTGDMADTAQVNEVRWAVRALDGGRLDPFSGRRVAPGEPCRVDRAARRAINRGVAQRRYAGTPRARRALARWPGVLDRAQQPFVAEGLDVPWYSARGNHDALPQGHYGPAEVRPRATPTGCRKLFARGGRSAPLGISPWALLARRRSAARPVAPDPRRRFLRSAAEFRQLHGRADHAHGFALTGPGEMARSRGSALYYSWSPRPGLRFVALDTTVDAGGPNGNIDHPQYRWLTRELRMAKRRREIVAVYGHHPLEQMSNHAPDELAGRFDRDPRDSRPIHLGRRGPASVRSLLLRHPNVILYLAGHKHYHRLWPNFRRDGHGFWQVITASLAGTPQQSRLVELMDNRDDTLSVFTTMVDHAAPVEAPAPGPAGGLSAAQLASISRTMAWSRRTAGSGVAPGSGEMRNAELVLPDPR